jgi:hypothetical protein
MKECISFGRQAIHFARLQRSSSPEKQLNNSDSQGSLAIAFFKAGTLRGGGCRVIGAGGVCFSDIFCCVIGTGGV